MSLCFENFRGHSSTCGQTSRSSIKNGVNYLLAQGPPWSLRHFSKKNLAWPNIHVSVFLREKGLSNLLLMASLQQPIVSWLQFCLLGVFDVVRRHERGVRGRPVGCARNVALKNHCLTAQSHTIPVPALTRSFINHSKKGEALLFRLIPYPCRW